METSRSPALAHPWAKLRLTHEGARIWNFPKRVKGGFLGVENFEILILTRPGRRSGVLAAGGEKYAKNGSGRGDAQGFDSSGRLSSRLFAFSIIGSAPTYWTPGPGRREIRLSI